jgi:hypothetical protein
VDFAAHNGVYVEAVGSTVQMLVSLLLAMGR